MTAPVAARGGWTEGGALVLFVASLMGILSLSLDVLLPAFPAMAASFGLAAPEDSRATLTVFVLAFGAGHLIHGPLADRFGRRPVLGVSLALFAAGSLWAGAAGSFDEHLAARFCQGLAAAGPRVVAVALLRDLRDGAALARDLSRAMMIYMLVPVVGPFVGQAVLSVGDWRAIPVLLAVAMLVPLAVTLFLLPETRPASSMGQRPVLAYRHNLAAVLTTRTSLCNTLAAGFAYGVMFGFIAVSPALYAAHFGVTGGFAALFATLGVSIAGASWLNARLVLRHGAPRLLRRAAAGLVLCATGLLLLALFPAGLAAFQIVLMAAMGCKAVVFANCNAIALQPHARIAGQASSLIGALTIMWSAGVAQALGAGYGQSLALFAALYLAGTCATLVLVLVRAGAPDRR